MLTINILLLLSLAVLKPPLVTLQVKGSLCFEGKPKNNHVHLHHLPLNMSETVASPDDHSSRWCAPTSLI